MNKTEFEKLQVGDRVWVSSQQDWKPEAKFLNGMLLTVREKNEKDGFVLFREYDRQTWGTDWQVNYAHLRPVVIPTLNLHLGEQMKIITTNDAGKFINDLSQALRDAGLPAEKVPSASFFITKILNDWLDKKKVEQWAAEYLRKETPAQALDLDKIRLPEKKPKKPASKREIATPAE